MAARRRTPRDRVKQPPNRDFRRLPPPVDLERVVVTHDVDPATHEVESKFATPDIADLARTGAIGGGF